MRKWFVDRSQDWVDSMKSGRIYWLALTLGISGVTFGVANAQVRPPQSSGVSGFIAVLPGVANIESNLMVNDATRKLDDLGSPDEDFNEAFPFITGELRYTFDDRRNQAYLGVPIENITEGTFFPEIGYRHWLADGTRLNIAGLWQPIQPPRAWEDPFVVGQRRKQTNVDSFGAKLGAERILGTGFGLRYEYAFRELDDEQSGTFLSAQPGSALDDGDLGLLERDANYHRFSANYRFALSDRLSLVPAFRYTLGDADGDSNSFDSYRPQFAILYDGDAIDFSATLSYEISEYDEDNPIFGDARDDETLGAFATASYNNIFGWRNVALVGQLIYLNGDSDVNFYDREIISAGVGFSYTFGAGTGDLDHQAEDIHVGN